MSWPAEVISASFFAMPSHILAGDDQTIRIWDLQSQKISQTFDDPLNRWGQITCMTVSDVAITGGAMLCCGTGRGQIVILRRTKKKVGGPRGNDKDRCFVMLTGL